MSRRIGGPDSPSGRKLREEAMRASIERDKPLMKAALDKAWREAGLEPPIPKVRHADLPKWSDSAYKVCCPFCKDGLLMVNRNPETMELLRVDVCVSCGQAVEYLDEEINGEKLVGCGEG